MVGSVVATDENDDIDIHVNGDDLDIFVGQRARRDGPTDLTRVVSQRRLGDHDTGLRVTSPNTGSVAGKLRSVCPEGTKIIIKVPTCP